MAPLLLSPAGQGVRIGPPGVRQWHFARPMWIRRTRRPGSHANTKPGRQGPNCGQSSGCWLLPWQPRKAHEHGVKNILVSQGLSVRDLEALRHIYRLICPGPPFPTVEPTKALVSLRSPAPQLVFVDWDNITACSNLRSDAVALCFNGVAKVDPQSTAENTGWFPQPTVDGTRYCRSCNPEKGRVNQDTRFHDCKDGKATSTQANARLQATHR